MGKLRAILARQVNARMQNSAYHKQALLARRAGIAQSHVSRLLNSRAGVTIDTLEAVAEAFDCEPYELLIDDDQARRALIERLMKGPDGPAAGASPKPDSQIIHIPRRRPQRR
jgi:transcriptional regulator with XRE-family HTH domain